MNLTTSPRTYKVISLLLKAAILVVSFWYILYKLNEVNSSDRVDLIQALSSAKPLFLLIAFSFMFLNWGIEAFKWKLLIAPLEPISFSKALKSVFAGVTVSIFMPNRVGEFAGRIFFLEKANKVEATLKNFVGSSLQLFITMLLGMLAVYMAAERSQGYWSLSGMVNLRFLKWGVFAAVVILLLVVVANWFRSKFSPQIQSYFNAVFATGSATLLRVFVLSLLRYSVFLIQYELILVAFGVSPGLIISLVIIAITFLVTSIIPSFAFTEIVTRGAVAASLFQFVGADATKVVVASTVVWIINLAIPALIGSAFISKLKFFKS